MTKSKKSRPGFRLSELLIVLFVMAILFTFVLAWIPRFHGPHSVSDAQNTMNQVRLALEGYYVENGSYPPIYGYLDTVALMELSEEDRAKILNPGEIDTHFNSSPSCKPDVAGNCYSDRYFVGRHYMDFLGEFGNTDLYDYFGLDYNDTDFDGYISRLEYVPDGGVDSSIVEYSTEMVDGQRPFVYIPVNMRQFSIAAREWILNWKRDDNRSRLGPRPGDSFARNPALEAMHFPPPRYDAYVLISLGPDRNTRGLLYDLVGMETALQAENYRSNYLFHVAAIASFFMATRDLNIIDVESGQVDRDDELDFEFDGRRSGGQDQFESNQYPDVEGPGILGPLIVVGGAFSREHEDDLLGVK